MVNEFQRWFLSQIEFKLRQMDRYERERYFEQKNRDLKVLCYMLIHMTLRLYGRLLHYNMELLPKLFGFLIFFMHVIKKYLMGCLYVIVLYTAWTLGSNGADQLCRFGDICNETTVFCGFGRVLKDMYGVNCSEQIWLDSARFIYNLTRSHI